MACPWQRPHKSMAAGLDDAQALSEDSGECLDPPLASAVVMVPRLTHEADT